MYQAGQPAESPCTNKIRDSQHKRTPNKPKTLGHRRTCHLSHASIHRSLHLQVPATLKNERPHKNTNYAYGET